MSAICEMIPLKSCNEPKIIWLLSQADNLLLQRWKISSLSCGRGRLPAIKIRPRPPQCSHHMHIFFVMIQTIAYATWSMRYMSCVTSLLVIKKNPTTTSMFSLDKDKISIRNYCFYITLYMIEKITNLVSQLLWFFYLSVWTFFFAIKCLNFRKIY